MSTTEYPRIKDLPEREREPFRKWLAGQTRPMLPDLPADQQDGYFSWDYNRWKSGMPIVD